MSGGRAPVLTGSNGNPCAHADEVVSATACLPNDNLGMAALSLVGGDDLPMAPVLLGQDAEGRLLKGGSMGAPDLHSDAGVQHDLGACVDRSLGVGLDVATGPARCLTRVLGLPPAIALDASHTAAVGLAEALSDFLLTASLPSSPALLPLPVPDPQLTPTPPQAGAVAAPLPRTGAASTEAGGPRCSGRLAAKPNRGLSAEERARLVLLKRSGIVLHDGPPEAEELQRYRMLYSKQLPGSFIQAVTELVAATSSLSKHKAARDQVACT